MLAPFESLPRYRAFSGNRFIASCPGPSHTSGDRNPSLSGRIAGDRLLITCRSGCTTDQVLAAMGLTWGDLFDGGTVKDPMRQFKRDVMAGFNAWREAELTRCAAELRRRDQERMQINDRVREGMTESTAWALLESTYQDYADLEWRFEVFRTGSHAQVLELYRNA